MKPHAGPLPSRIVQPCSGCNPTQNNNRQWDFTSTWHCKRKAHPKRQVPPQALPQIFTGYLLAMAWAEPVFFLNTWWIRGEAQVPIVNQPKLRLTKKNRVCAASQPWMFKPFTSKQSPKVAGRITTSSAKRPKCLMSSENDKCQNDVDTFFTVPS